MREESEQYNVPKETSNTEFIGYRAWMNRLLLEKTEVGGFEIGFDIMSLFYPTVWEGPVLVADEKPTPNNRHGVYACKDREEVTSEGHTFYGSIALSGTVIEHEKGYRGEKGVIREMWFNQQAVVSIAFQMLETPGLAKNLPHWEEVYRWLVSPTGVADKMAEKYQCECHVSHPYNQQELEADVERIRQASTKNG